MVAVDLIKDPAIVNVWPLRRILKYSRLHNWVSTSPEERAEAKEKAARAAWKQKIKATQHDYAKNKVVSKSTLEGAK